MPDNRFQSKKVSDEWDVVLTDVAKRVAFRLNSGRRTMAEQWYLWRHRGQPGFAALVAFPNPNAPHIKVGRPNHSLDVDTNVGDGENALQRELEDIGLVIVNDVAGEPWHQTAPDAARLRRVAARIEAQRDDTPTLRKGVVNHDAVRRLQRLLRGLNLKGVPLNGKYELRTRQAVRRFQKKHHLHVDGVVGPRTWAMLRRASR